MLGMVSYSFPFGIVFLTTLAGPKVELHPVGRNDSLASWWTRFLIPQHGTLFPQSIWLIGETFGEISENEELMLHQRSALGQSAADLVTTHGILASTPMDVGVVDVIQTQKG